MMFRKEHGKVNVTSLVERDSRYAVVMRNEDRQSKPIMEKLIDGLSPLPADAGQSITFDRGTEFAAWRRLKAASVLTVGSVIRPPRGRKEQSKTPTIGCEATCPDQLNRRP